MNCIFNFLSSSADKVAVPLHSKTEHDHEIHECPSVLTSKEKKDTMTFKTLLTMIIVAYVLYYAYQIIHDLFFAKGSIVQDELEIEEEVDISGEAGKYKPTEVHRSDIPITQALPHLLAGCLE